jgi:hypothetical protein
MIFYKNRDQAAVIWDPAKNAPIIRFERQSRDKYGVDGVYETDDKKEIKLLQKLGYESDGEEPKDQTEQEAIKPLKKDEK